MLTGPEDVLGVSMWTAYDEMRLTAAREARARTRMLENCILGDLLVALEG